MQTTDHVASGKQATYPECINETKSGNRAQALWWLLIAAVLFAIYYQQPDKDSTLSLAQMAIIALSVIMAVVKFFVNSSKLIYTPTGSTVSKQSYSFSVTLQADILRCLEEGNTSRLKAFKTDDAGGLLVELIESEDRLFVAARLLKYEPHGYEAKTDWYTMKK